MRPSPYYLSRLPLLALVVLQASHAFKLFQNSVPNGGNIPAYCSNDSNQLVASKADDKDNEGESPFEQDFNANGKKWTRILCMKDSDGDGMSNGEELGDPNCVWIPGMEPLRAATSHPGVCEPIQDTKCLPTNAWLPCRPLIATQSHEYAQADQPAHSDHHDHSAHSHHHHHHAQNDGNAPMSSENCAQKLNKTDSTTIDIRLAKVKVPSNETTYMCQIFNLSMTFDLHMVAVLPLVETVEVVHHIILFGCDPRGHEEVTGQPEVCGIMPPQTCRSLIGTWTMGSTGECAHPGMGFLVGPHGYRQVFMQVHFNNPTHLKGLMDTSGLRLYFTKSLRPNHAGMLIVGQRALQIEPLGYQEGGGDEPDHKEHRYGSQSVTFTSECPSHCTRHMFGKGIYITSAVNHMHTLGMSQSIEVYRNNSLIHTITNQDNYNYNYPLIYKFEEPLHVLPGDELRTTCVYKRPRSQQPVCFGEATSDEMCFGFITYFPSQKLAYPWCTSMGSLVSCERHLPQLGKHPISDCRWWEFRNVSRPETKTMFGRVLLTCYPTQNSLQCTDSCKDVVNKLLAHPCLQGDVGSYMMDRFKLSGKTGRMLMDALVTCTCRYFPYCDRKLPKGILGSEQTNWCPSDSMPSKLANDSGLSLDAGNSVPVSVTRWNQVPVLLFVTIFYIIL